MYYFNSFPKINTIDYSGNLITLTNLLKRVEIQPSLLNNPMLFYSYDIQDGDTPDIVANKYYGDSYRYWFVLLANQTLDPQWQWPLTSQQFTSYILDKYRNDTANSLSISVDSVTTAQIMSNIFDTVHQYTKTIITIENDSLTQTSKTIVIDYPTYLSTITGSTTQSFSNSTSSVTQIVSVNAQSIYDYEIELNESKRNINLINSSYTSQFEAQLSSLLGQ